MWHTASQQKRHSEIKSSHLVQERRYQSSRMWMSQWCPLVIQVAQIRERYHSMGNNPFTNLVTSGCASFRNMTWYLVDATSSAKADCNCRVTTRTWCQCMTVPISSSPYYESLHDRTVKWWRRLFFFLA